MRDWLTLCNKSWLILILEDNGNLRLRIDFQDQDGRQLINESTEESLSSREQSKELLSIWIKTNMFLFSYDKFYVSYFRSMADMYFQLKLESLRSCAEDLAQLNK